MKMATSHATILAIISSLILGLMVTSCNPVNKEEMNAVGKQKQVFVAPDTAGLPNNLWGETVRYGKELVHNTAYYIGPDGTKGHYLGNRMNCTNCHLKDGTKPYGFNFFFTHKIYPQYRARENRILTLADRVNNCIERPHLGKQLPLESKELLAMVSYIKWIGEGYDTSKYFGHGAKEIDYHNRTANPEKGAALFAMHCTVCHQANGEGLFNAAKTTYVYPPLWGNESYREGSSLNRVLTAAAFIKNNMPNETTWEHPVLSDQEALDLAAFVNNKAMHPRPISTVLGYPNLATKPIDYAVGPYQDTFSAQQHTFGPWTPIEDYYKQQKLTKK